MRIMVKRSPTDRALTQAIRELTQARDLVRYRTAKRATRMSAFRTLAGVQATCEIVKLALRDNK